MFCMECGETITAEAKFCAKCGAKAGAVVLSPSPSANSAATVPVPKPVEDAKSNKRTIRNSLGVFLAVVLYVGFQYFSPSESSIIDRIWQAYTTYPDNVVKGISRIEVKGHLIKKGTVLPSALSSSTEGRLPAYLACYDFVTVMNGMGDMKTNLCIYYIENPSRNTHGILWRGKEYANQLESKMNNDGFLGN